MVRFHSRRIKKYYKKGKEYSYKRFYSDYPAELTKELEPIEDKDYEVEEFRRSRTDKRERVHVTYGRDIPANQTEQEAPK
jgi:hypothetical protein